MTYSHWTQHHSCRVVTGQCADGRTCHACHMRTSCIEFGHSHTPVTYSLWTQPHAHRVVTGQCDISHACLPAHVLLSSNLFELAPDLQRAGRDCKDRDYVLSTVVSPRVQSCAWVTLRAHMCPAVTARLCPSGLDTSTSLCVLRVSWTVWLCGLSTS